MTPPDCRNDKDSKRTGISVLGEKVNNNIVIAVLMAAIMYYLSHYFVTKEQYDRDQMRVETHLNSIEADIKILISRKP